MDDEASIRQRQKTALAELASLGRVSHRLALVDTTERLQTVLEKLLPRLLKRIGDNHKVQLDFEKCNDHQQLKETHDKIHAKLVEMLGHAMKRVRDDKGCQLPCLDILNLLLEAPCAVESRNDDGKKETIEAEKSDNYCSMSIPIAKSTVDPFTLNLALAFLTLGLPRCSEPTQIESLLPSILVLVGYYSGLESIRTAAKRMQSNQVAHLLLRGLEQLVQFENATSTKINAKNKKGANNNKWMALAREVCQRDARASRAVFDLLLDGLLYQPVAINSNIPPCGLSQWGHERLKQGSSSIARDWAAEKATRMKLMDFKLAILDFVSPSRRWAIFMADKETSTFSASSGSQTVALLVVASGDFNPEVAQRATTYLKMYHDSFRTGQNTQPGGDVECKKTRNMTGESLRLCCSLLYLVLGQSNAESALSKTPSKSNESEWLGLPPDEPNSSDSSQLVLSLKRRAAAGPALASIMNYIGDKILGGDPQIFNSLEHSQVMIMAQLCLLAAQRTLSNLRTSSGQTVLQAKSHLAAAQLLNVLCIRLSTFYDTISTDRDTTDPETNGAVLSVMSRALAVACSVLSPASSPRPSATTAIKASASSMEGSVAIRDACYGVVCTLSRSHFVLAEEGYIFACGERIANNGKVSIDTASLLFGCATNEVEVLLPRATAALDALLGAYLRVYGAPKKEINEGETYTVSSANPWADPAADVSCVSREAEEDQGITMDRSKVAQALLPLLWAASQCSQSKASRVASARWTSDFVKTLEVSSACHLLCFLAGDVDVTAASIARNGLGLPSKLSLASSDDDFSAASSEELPSFSDFVASVFPSSMKAGQGSPGDFFHPKYWDFSLTGRSTSVRFGLVCLFADVYGGEGEYDAIRSFIATLADTLILFGSKASGVEVTRVQGSADVIDLLEECTRCLVATLGTSAHARSLIIKNASSTNSEVSLCLQDLEFLCTNTKVNSVRARRYLAEACGKLYEDDALWRDEDGNLEMDGWLARTGVDKSLLMCTSTLENARRNLQIGEFHGAAVLGAHSFRAMRLLASKLSAKSTSKTCDKEASCWQTASQFIHAISLSTLHSDEVVSNASSDALAVAFHFNAIDAPTLDTRLYDSVASGLSNIALALDRFGTKNETLDVTRTAKLVVAAGKCLAASTSGAGAKANPMTDDSIGLGSARLSCVDALASLLGSLAYRKDEEIALLTGEALALYADAYSPEGAVWSSQVKEWPKEYDERQAKELPPFQHAMVLLVRNTYQSNSPHKRTATAAALLGIVARAANGVNTTASYSSRSLVVEIKRNMAELQQVFISLLSDPKSKHLSRECCCLGLAACRGLSTKATSSEESADHGSGSGASCTTEELNHRLLRAFGQTTNYWGSAYQETREQAAERRERERSEPSRSTVMDQFGEENVSEVGGASGLSESALTSYKEMAAAAVSLGRNDVLYSLLLLSVSHPVWFLPRNRFKYSAASLLGSDSLVGSPTNSKALRVALRPHLGKLIPRVLRARYDPNKQTREQMEALWVGLTGGGAESRAAITEHLLPTIDLLVEDCTNKSWRARAGACGALAEILVGRSWENLGGGPGVFDDDDVHTRDTSKLTAGIRLVRLFRVSMRALDDVRGNVRDAGQTLARTVRGLSICLCNPALKNDFDGSKHPQEALKTHERNASAASATTLRWLLKHGLNQQCPEATGICVSCLVGIIGVVKSKILQPLIPDLLKSLLISMSGLEPSALNYLQVRAGAQESDSALSYDNLERLRLRLAQSGPLADAVTKLIEMLPTVGIETQREAIPQLDTALRCSVGFASRAATADAVSSLCQSCPNAFQFPGLSNTNPSVRLLRALYFASEREKGQGARDKMVHALGNLAALCPGSSVRVLAIKSCNKYKNSTGNNDNPASRRACASALRSIAVRANNQLSDGGPSDVWFQRVLPCAFLGRKDTDPKISSLWGEVWEEGIIAISTSHMDESLGTIEELLLPHLVEECCSALMDLSWTRRVGAAHALIELADRGLLSPAPRPVNGSKSTVGSSEREARRSKASRKAVNTLVELLCRPRLWTGKSFVVECAVKICVKWSSANLYGETDTSHWPWQPVLISRGKHTQDLFLDDGWFGHKHLEAENMEVADVKGDTLSPAGIDPEGEDKLDFEEYDKQDENEEQSGECPSDKCVAQDSTVSKVLTFIGFASFLADEAIPSSVSSNQMESEELLPYRVKGLCGLRDLMASLIGSQNNVKRDLYLKLAQRLLSLCVLEKSCSEPGVPPVIVARSIDCLAVCWWEGISDEDFIGHDVPRLLELAKLLKDTGGEKQSAWTVREATRLCLARLAAHCKPTVLREPLFVSIMMDCASLALNDRKFWKVRLAGLTLMRSLVGRAGTTKVAGVTQTAKDGGEQLLLEAILPQKEDIMALARKSLIDPEAQVTALSSEILEMMSWWP